MAVTRRQVEGLVTMALELEERARKITGADPSLARKARVSELHRAAQIIADVGRDLRAALST